MVLTIKGYWGSTFLPDQGVSLKLIGEYIREEGLEELSHDNWEEKPEWRRQIYELSKNERSMF